jgi:predicted acylesterase/phospholipase RssA
MKESKVALINHAKEYLRGKEATAEELLALARQLKGRLAFDYARRLFEKAAGIADRNSLIWVEIVQQQASCTARNPDLPLDIRMDAALRVVDQILPQAEALAARSAELGDEAVRSQALKLEVGLAQDTLGVAGEVYKQKWHTTGDREDLAKALAKYQQGALLGVSADQGFTAINAAFVLDLIAELDRVEAANDVNLQERNNQRRQEASRLRLDIVSRLEPVARGLPPTDRGPDGRKVEWWWTWVTVAEAYLGLGEHEKATRALLMASSRDVEPYQYETTIRQLAQLARLHEGCEKTPQDLERESPAWKVLLDFLGPERGEAVRSAFAGKVGLALSGGGFRASLFHLGVLARLAELDVLRHVEVLSCVSGGSIIGAHYYLELRRLLESKPEAGITRDDYIRLVKRVRDHFMDFVQTNPRMRAFAVPWRAVAALLPGAWRRSAMAHVLETGLYAPLVPRPSGCRRWHLEVPLSGLYISPEGEAKDFDPRTENWRRAHKVPMLVLNAACLNTGHCWQFTASWMGEPVASIDTEVDGNERMRRMYYSEAPTAYREFSLGQAVAASACVPAIFRPVTLKGLFPDRVVRLVDGGVYDNQGIDSLLEEECTLLLVSDASGQLASEDNPGFWRWSTMVRSSSVQASRVRGEEHRRLVALQKSGTVRATMFLHLKKDLGSQPVDWIECDDPKSPDEMAGMPIDALHLTTYGIRADVQNLLSGIRTDLDVFNDAEANALMTSGYRMAQFEFPRSIPALQEIDAPAGDWPFLRIERLMTETSGTERFIGVLQTSRHVLLKWLPRFAVPMCFKTLARGAGYLLLFVLLFAYVSAIWWAAGHWVLPQYGLVLRSLWTIAVAAVAIAPTALVIAAITIVALSVVVATAASLLTVTFVLAWITHLLWLIGKLGDWFYLRRGSLNNVLKDLPR